MKKSEPIRIRENMQLNRQYFSPSKGLFSALEGEKDTSICLVFQYRAFVVVPN